MKKINCEVSDQEPNGLDLTYSKSDNALFVEKLKDHAQQNLHIILYFNVLCFYSLLARPSFIN